MTKSKKKKRVDLDVRPYPAPIHQNYDYGGPEDGSDVSPGTGLYHGKMDKYKSVKEFIEKSRKRFRKRRKKAWRKLIFKIADDDYENKWKHQIEEHARGNPKPFSGWFDNKDRVYIPFETTKEESSEEINEYRDDVIKALRERYPGKCEEIDFVGGYCTQGNRKQRIGKLLTSARNREIKEIEKKLEEIRTRQTEDETSYEYDPEYIQLLRESEELRQYWIDIVNAFTNSPIRAGVKTRKNIEYYVVISQNPHDLARMSTGRSWSSCMTLGSGQYHTNVFCEVEKGGLVAYLIKANDLEIEDPIARIHIRRFENMDGDSFAKAEDVTYGEEIPGFSEVVDEWIIQKQKSIKPGIYKRMGGSYSDTFESGLTVAPTSPETEEEMFMWLNSPKEVEGAIIDYWVVIDDFQNNEDDCDEGEMWHSYVEGIPLEKQFSDQKSADQYAEIMNSTEWNWALMEALEKEVFSYVSYSEFGSYNDMSRDDIEDELEAKGLSEEEVKEKIEEEISGSPYNRYLDPSYDRFQVQEAQDDRTGQMQRAVVNEILSADKGSFSNDLVTAVQHHIFNTPASQYGGGSQLKDKFIEKFSDEYPDLYKYFDKEMSDENLNRLSKSYESLKDGPQKEEVREILEGEIEWIVDRTLNHLNEQKLSGVNSVVNISEVYNRLNLAYTLKRIPANLISKMTELGTAVLDHPALTSSNKESIISHIIHNFSMSNSDIPDVQRFYEQLIPLLDLYPPKRRWATKEEGPPRFTINDAGYAIARLGENGRQFIPFFKEKFNEIRNWTPKEGETYFVDSKEGFFEKFKSSPWEDQTKTLKRWEEHKSSQAENLNKFKKAQLGKILYVIDALENGTGYSKKYNWSQTYGY